MSPDTITAAAFVSETSSASVVIHGSGLRRGVHDVPRQPFFAGPHSNEEARAGSSGPRPPRQNIPPATVCSARPPDSRWRTDRRRQCPDVSPGRNLDVPISGGNSIVAAHPMLSAGRGFSRSRAPPRRLLFPCRTGWQAAAKKRCGKSYDARRTESLASIADFNRPEDRAPHQRLLRSSRRPDHRAGGACIDGDATVDDRHQIEQSRWRMSTACRCARGNARRSAAAAGRA